MILNPQRRIGLLLHMVAGAAAGFLAPTLACGQAAAPADANAASPHYLRVVDEKEKSIALEICTRDFVPTDGVGPRVGLVGVAHIGDRSFYRAVQQLLDQYDLVLYESVKPPGAARPGGDTDEQRIQSTKAAIQFVGSLIEAQLVASHKYPVDLEALSRFAAAQDPRLAEFLKAASVDAWGQPLVYKFIEEVATAPKVGGEIDTDPQAPVTDAVGQADDVTHVGSYSVMSLGADGKPGGEGVNADLLLADLPKPQAHPLSDEDNLQGQLASALGLKFQLDALNYDLPNWRCSDMTMDEVDRRLQAKGLDFGPLGGTLAGSSLPAKLISIFLNLMRFFDSFMEGAIADTFKVVMIELLGDESIMEQSLDQFGAGFGEVIINDRNQVAIDDLKQLIQTEPEVKSVAILYGAGHMPDLSRRLADQLGYQPAMPTAEGDNPGEHWLTAIRVDLTQSAVSQTQINQIRVMMKQMIRQQFGQRRGAKNNE